MSDLEIFPNEFVPNVQASDAYKRWARTSPGDRGRWEAFRDALLADPATAVVPTMSTRFGKALVAAGREHMSISRLVGAPTVPSFDIPTYDLSQAGGAGIHAIWLHHTSPTMSEGSWGGIPCRQVCWATHGYEYWCLYEIRIPSSYPINPEANYALPMDLHSVGGETSWNGQPPGYETSPMHIRYEDGNILLQQQPQQNLGLQHEFIITPNLSKDVWHSVVVHVIFGRQGLSVPGHPNGGMGRTRIYVDGSDVPYDTGNVSNIWEAAGGLAATTRLTILEGHYGTSNPGTLNSSITAQRWGRTLAEAINDSSVTLRASSSTGGSSYSVAASRNSSDFLMPSPLPS